MSRTDRSRTPIIWLQLLLVGGLASVVLILSQTYRTSSSSQAVVERAMRDYAGFAAWSFREHLVTRLREAIDEVLGPVNHGEGYHTSAERRVPEARDLGHYLRWDTECKCHRPRRGPLPIRYVGFTLGSDTLAIGTNLAPAGNKGWIVDPPEGITQTIPTMVYSADEEAWINSLLSGLARERPRPNWGYHVVVARRDSTTRAFASRSMPTEWGDTVIYAVEYPASSIDSLFREVLASSDLLPPSLVAHRRNVDVLNLEVSDASGEPLYRSHESIDWEFDATSQLPPSYGGLRLRAQLRPQHAEALLIGGVPTSRVPLLLVLLALALGLTTLAAVQLRREVRFATERTNFVANVSHELRTPLTQVRLVLDTLRLGRGGDAKARDSALGVADREVLRLQHLAHRQRPGLARRAGPYGSAERIPHCGRWTPTRDTPDADPALRRLHAPVGDECDRLPEHRISGSRRTMRDIDGDADRPPGGKEQQRRRNVRVERRGPPPSRGCAWKPGAVGHQGVTGAAPVERGSPGSEAEAEADRRVRGIGRGRRLTAYRGGRQRGDRRGERDPTPPARGAAPRMNELHECERRSHAACYTRPIGPVPDDRHRRRHHA